MMSSKRKWFIIVPGCTLTAFALLWVVGIAVPAILLNQLAEQSGGESLGPIPAPSALVAFATETPLPPTAANPQSGSTPAQSPPIVTPSPLPAEAYPTPHTPDLYPAPHESNSAGSHATATAIAASTIAALFFQNPSPVPVAETSAPEPTYTAPQPTSNRIPFSDEVLIPAGNFWMGCAPQDGECWPDEKPAHTVFLNAYYMDVYEVTNARYRACVDAGTCSPPRSNGSNGIVAYYNDMAYSNFPVVNIDWEQAVAFCAWDGKRLPTEAEWEKAARGMDTRRYPWGDAPPTSSRLNYNLDPHDTVAVGSYPSGVSPYGIHDMAGNVREWTADWYDSDYYAQAPSTNPLGPRTGRFRVLRGGSFANLDFDVRTSAYTICLVSGLLTMGSDALVQSERGVTKSPGG
jgi:formylglycine-generating enzyme required for sulfatase activity